MASPGIRAEADYFGATYNAYAYTDGGIYLASRTPRKRVFLPLRDGAVYRKQIKIRILEDGAVILIPVERKPKRRGDWANRVAVSLGYVTMFTTSSGNAYGEKLGGMLSERTRRIGEKVKARNACHAAYMRSLRQDEDNRARRIRANNLGARKFLAQNQRELRGINAYIHGEITRMLETEKPCEIIIPVRSKQFSPMMNKESKRKLSRWTVGYIRKRLADKCAANGVAVTEVSAAYTGIVCARCGAVGRRANQVLICEICDTRDSYPLNAARNLLKKAEKTFVFNPS
jgi:transposase